MNHWRLALVASSLFFAGCRGTIPTADGLRKPGIAAVLIAGRCLLPNGETHNCRMAINLEGEGGREAEVYRLPLRDAQTRLYQVEPNLYHLYPTRSIFGGHQQILKVQVDGRTYRAPFPRDILRKPEILIKPSKIVSLGILEAKILPALPGQRAAMTVRLDDSVAARRQLVQDAIHNMMNPNAPVDLRESAISWTHALENSLIDVLAEEDHAPLYSPAP